MYHLCGLLGRRVQARYIIVRCVSVATRDQSQTFRSRFARETYGRIGAFPILRPIIEQPSPTYISSAIKAQFSASRL